MAPSSERLVLLVFTQFAVRSETTGPMTQNKNKNRRVELFAGGGGVCAQRLAYSTMIYL